MNASCRSRCARRHVAVLAAGLLLMVAGWGLGQGEWEMRVCADPAAYPFSSSERPGIDNRVAEIVADELEADLTYEWTPSNAGAVRQHLQPGGCDILMGAAEGAEGVLNTVPYYQAPFMFVYRSDSEFKVESLEDEVLKELEIAISPNGLAQYVLSQMGLVASSMPIAPDRTVRGYQRINPMIEAVLQGDADLAIVYGPEAAVHVQEHSGELVSVPVRPQIVPPLVQMFRITTMGVREGDEALRDRLGIAVARRWDDIRAVFDELEIEVMESPPPFAREQDFEGTARVGAVLPVPSGRPAATDAMASSAWRGAQLAENLLLSAAQEGDLSPEVLIASSPSADAAVRAADRLAATEDVNALIGGVGDQQAAALSDAAERNEVLFFNLAATEQRLRAGTCSPNTFHIEASASMYLHALVDWFRRSGKDRWFLVAEESEEGRELLELARQTLAAAGEGVQEVGVAEIPPGPGSQGEALQSAAQAEPDVVLLLLAPQDQEYLLSQYQLYGLEAPVTGLPHPVMQTRDYLARLLQVAPGSARFRAALWETTLEEGGAGDLNERYVSRFGEPLEPSGWAAFAAVTITHRAANEAQGAATEGMIEFLEGPQAEFELRKGPATRFDPATHQLQQPLYVVEIDPEASWGRQVSRRLALVRDVTQVPEPGAGDYAQELSQLGALGEEGSCGQE